jgi:hypothetical protein
MEGGMGTKAQTSEARVARLFGLKGDNWLRHANPVSVWTRFTVVSLLALSIWSRVWIGWFCLVPIALTLVWMMVNPLLFPEPRSTRNWASKSVFGERLWSERTSRTLPPQFTARVLNVANLLSSAGLLVLAYGLWKLELVPVLAGIVLAHTGKSWYLDRMVLLFDDVKQRDPAVAAWEF